MIERGPTNLITDVAGILVGNAEDERIRTGSTVVLCREPALAAVDVRGAAPGTRETDLLDPTCLVERIDAIVLSGGSAFGLEAPAGVMNWLAEQGRGFAVGSARIPIVPGAILFDLLNGGDKAWGAEPPYRELGRRAAESAGADFALGNAGAGYGARAGPLKGGLGSVSAVDSPLQVGALMAVNACGGVTIPGTSTLWAWPFERGNELGGQPPPQLASELDLDYGFDAALGAQTTIGVVATNARLDKAQAKRVAMMAHDGLARAIWPAHTPFDGDTLFVIATGQATASPTTAAALGRLGTIAADCVARAIGRAVVEAETLGDMPSYRELHGGNLGRAG